MKKILSVLTFYALLSCSKKDAAEPIIPITVTDLIINGQPSQQNAFSVGQYFAIRPIVSDSINKLTYRWELSPLSEGFSVKDTGATWVPQTPGDYEMTVTASNEKGGSGSKKTNFRILKSDYRYELWGNDINNVYLNEAMNQSELLSVDGNASIFQITKVGPGNGWYNDISEVGDYVGYIFDGDNKLQAGVTIFLRDYDVPNTYLGEYERIKERLLEYTFVSTRQIWDQTRIAQQYKDVPELLGSAVEYGYVILETVFQTDRTRMIIEMEGSGSSVVISIKYLKK